MIEPRVTKRYVKGFIQAAKDRDCVDEVEQVLKNFDILLKKNREAVDILYHPVISIDHKKKLIHKLLGDEVPDTLKKFMDYVIDKKRERIIEPLYEEYKAAADALRGIRRARVRYAFEFSAGQVERLKSALEKSLGGKVELEFELDKTILGGMQVFVDTYMFDGSITGRLNQLQKHLLNKVGQLKTAA